MDLIQRREFREPDRAAVQDEVIASVLSDPASYLRAYAERTDTYGGRYVCSDAFKELFSAYRATPETRDRYNTPVHNAAAVLASAQFVRAVHDAGEPERNTAMFLTGIPGAGKTSTVVATGFPSYCRVLFEGQLNRPETSIPKFDLALDAGLKIDIVAVHVPPEQALERTLQRHAKLGRGASLGTMADIQGGLPDGLRRLHQRYGSALHLTILDNTPGRSRSLDGWEHLSFLEKEGDREHIARRLEHELERRRATQRVTDGGYRQALGMAPLGRTGHKGLGGGGLGGLDRDEHRRSVSAGGGFAADLARPSRALAFEQLTESEALRKHPELLGAYRQLHQSALSIGEQTESPEAVARRVSRVRLDLQQRLDSGKIPAPPSRLPDPTRQPSRDR